MGVKLTPKVVTEIKFSDVFAVELIDYGLVHESNLPNAGKFLVGHDNEVCFHYYLFCVL